MYLEYHPAAPGVIPKADSPLTMEDSVREKTDQERFWEGPFGDEYTERNQMSPEGRKPFFSRVLARTSGVRRICELGSNRGHNLVALQQIDASLQLTGVELNQQAYLELVRIPGVRAIHSSIQDLDREQRFDLVFTCGVLIHFEPEDLPAVYRRMAELADHYVLVSEYFSPSPAELAYRGHAGKLFKRDFGGEFLDVNSGQFTVVDYGFLWKRLEPAWDNVTWWLFERS